MPFDARATRQKLIARDSDRCAHCRRRKKVEDLTIDHIIPKIAGGGNTLENLQLLCQRCNIIKKEKPDPFRIGRINPEKVDLYIKWATAYGVLADMPVYLVLESEENA